MNTIKMRCLCVLPFEGVLRTTECNLTPEGA